MRTMKKKNYDKNKPLYSCVMEHVLVSSIRIGYISSNCKLKSFLSQFISITLRYNMSYYIF